MGTAQEVPKGSSGIHSSLSSPHESSHTQEIQTAGLSVQAPSLSNSDMLQVTTVVQQIITEFSEAV
jgi:hypothetical protein